MGLKRRGKNELGLHPPPSKLEYTLLEILTKFEVGIRPSVTDF